MIGDYRMVGLAAGLAIAAGGCAARGPTEPPPPTAVHLALDTTTRLQGDTVFAAATIDATDGASTAVTWSSSDTSIAEIDQTGRVIAKRGGAVVITVASAVDPAIRASATLHVRSNVALIGDSIILQLGTLTTWFGPDASRWVNAGVAGNQSWQVLARLDTTVKPLRTDVCVLLIGINDIAGGAGTVDTRESVLPPGLPTNEFTSLGGYIDSIRVHLAKRAVKLVLTAIPPVAATNSHASVYNPDIATFDGWLRAYAPLNDLPIVDLVPLFSLPDGTGNPALYQSDGLHPNASGQAVLTTAFAAKLKALGALP